MCPCTGCIRASVQKWARPGIDLGGFGIPPLHREPERDAAEALRVRRVAGAQFNCQRVHGVPVCRQNGQLECKPKCAVLQRITPRRTSIRHELCARIVLDLHAARRPPRGRDPGCRRARSEAGGRPGARSRARADRATRFSPSGSAAESCQGPLILGLGTPQSCHQGGFLLRAPRNRATRDRAAEPRQSIVLVLRPPSAFTRVAVQSAVVLFGFRSSARLQFASASAGSRSVQQGAERRVRLG